MRRRELELSRALRVVLALGLVELVACGSVTAIAPDAGGDASQDHEREGKAVIDVGAELAAAAPDVAGEARPALPACGGSRTLSFEGDHGVGANKWCVMYADGSRCVTSCARDDGSHPTMAEGPACTATGLPTFGGQLVCASSCSFCPAP